MLKYFTIDTKNSSVQACSIHLNFAQTKAAPLVLLYYLSDQKQQ